MEICHREKVHSESETEIKSSTGKDQLVIDTLAKKRILLEI